MDFSIHDLEFIYGVISTAKRSFSSALPASRFNRKDREMLEAMISDCERICKLIEDKVTAYVLAGGEINEAC